MEAFMTGSEIRNLSESEIDLISGGRVLPPQRFTDSAKVKGPFDVVDPPPPTTPHSSAITGILTLAP
jgi:hypothetical protein